MERKENDLFLNMVANPSFQLEDFATIGFNTDNTSLQEDKNVYKNNELIQKKFTDDEGKFDNKKFNDEYNKALINYNAMSLEAYNKASIAQVSYHRDNIFAPEDQRRKGPDFQRVVVPNPDRISSSMYRLGEMGERTKSRDELAQASRVLLNPAEVARGKEAKWGKSANDGFFDYFTDTLVMAAWDEDGTHIDPITGQEVQHQKGEFKISEDGTYYYEKLDGRDIYGKQVLNKMNILTTDGSKWNKYDFFDSDDINQKSVGGTIMKQAALVGTMFLPYVGPVIAGLSVASQLIGLTGTLGKMLTGSDSPTFSALEGFSKSWNRQTAKTEYAQENTWCWENFITLIGDVAAQLKEQRFVFEQVPAVFKGKYINSEKQMASLSEQFSAINKKKVEKQMLNISNKESWLNEDKLVAQIELMKKSAVETVADLNSWKKDYQKIGEVLSKGYMTAITVGDTYGEAKAAGASDLDATLLTLGYAAGEAAILNTGIGEWILPELRADKYKNKAIINALKKLEDDVEKGLKDFRALSGITDKKEYAKKLFNLGKDIAKANYVTGTRTAKAIAAAGLGEGVEEVSEELLADFSKGCYNTVNWLRGNDVRMDSFGYSWEDGKRSWDSKDLFDRYSMSFVGGLAGGALTNALTSFKQIKSYDNMSKESAIQEVVYMAREGQLGELIKTMDKMDLAEKNISATEFEMVDNKPVPKASDYAGSRDAAVKLALKQQFSIIENILKANNAHLSDKSFLDENTLKDLRFTELQKASTAGLFMQRYNSLASELVRLTLDINRGQSKDTNKDGVESDKESRTEQIIEDTYKEKKARLKEIQKELKDFSEGKMASKFIATTLFELTSTLSGHFVPVTFPLYAEYVSKKKYSELTKEELENLRTKYTEWKQNGDAKDRIYDAAQIFQGINSQASNTIKSSENLFKNQAKSVQDFVGTINYLQGLVAIEDPNVSSSEYYNDIHRANNALGVIETLKWEEKAKQLFEERKAKLNDLTNIADEAVRKQEEQRIIKSYKTEIDNLLVESVEKYLQEFINQGFATKEIKFQLTKAIDTAYNILQSRMGENNSEEENNAIANTARHIDSFKEQIENLNSSPFEKNLDEFATSIGEEPIKFTELVDKVNTSYTQSSSNIADFALEDPIIKELDHAISIVEMYRASILGARTDALAMNNLFGYNATINEVSAKVGEKTDFAEIDSQLADIMVADIDTNLNKLKSMRNLHSLNQGQKMNTQQRVGAKKDALIYKEIKRIIDIPDDELKNWKNFDKLKEIANLPLLTELENAESYLLTDEQLVELEKEKIQMSNAIHEFFNSNLDKFAKPETSKAFFSKFNLYTNSPEMLHESMTQIGDLNIISYIASLTAIKYEDFLTTYKDALDLSGNLVPVPSQEMSVFSNVAASLNGNIFDIFINAHRDYIKYDWTHKKIEDRKAILEELNPDFDQKNLDDFSANEMADYCFNFLTNVPRYTNITLINGMPGTGKTQAVIRQIISVLKKVKPELIDKAAIVHGVSQNSAEGLQQSLGLSENSTAEEKNSFLKRIIPNFNPFVYDDKGICQIDPSQYYINDKNEIVGKWTYNLSKDNAPSAIFIDEISRFNQYELDAINEYAQKMGIQVIAAGDFDQSGVVGRHPINYGTLTSGAMLVNARNTMFYGTPKLGVSMRAGLTMIANDVIAAQRFLQTCSESDNYLDLHANWSSGKLYGNFIGTLNELDSPHPIFNMSIKEQIKSMIDDLQEGEKIGFIFTESEDQDGEIQHSALYEYITTTPGVMEHFDLKGNSAQGLEARYYVTDMSEVGQEFYDSEESKQYFYTAMSRASQANIIVLDDNLYNEGRIKTSDKEALAIKQELTEDTKLKFSKQRLSVIEKSANGNQLTYTERTHSNPQENKQIEELVINNIVYEKDSILKDNANHYWKIKSIDKDNVVLVNITSTNGVYSEGREVSRTVEEFTNAINSNNLIASQLPSTQADDQTDQSQPSAQPTSQDNPQTAPQSAPQAQPSNELPTPSNIDVPMIIDSKEIDGVIYKQGMQLIDPKTGIIWTVYQVYEQGIELTKRTGPHQMRDWDSFKLAIDSGLLTQYDPSQPAPINTQQLQDFLEKLEVGSMIQINGSLIGLSDYATLEVTSINDDGTISYNVIGSQIGNSGRIKIEQLVANNASLFKSKDEELFSTDVDESFPKNDSNFTNEAPEETSTESVAKVQEKVDNLNDDSNRIQPPQIEIKNEKNVRLNMNAYSFNVFELGATIGERNLVKWADNADARIDSANGLRKIQENILGSDSFTEADKYLEELGVLHGLVLSATNREKLLSDILNCLELADINANFNIRFDFKSIAFKSNGDEYFTDRKDTDIWRLQKGRSEKAYHVRSDNPDSDPRTKQLVLILNSDNHGDILELPILTLTNAFTFIQQKNGNTLAFAKIIQEYNNWVGNPELQLNIDGKPAPDKIHQVGVKMEEFLTAQGYTNLANLFKVFNFDNFGLINLDEKFPDFLPSTYFKNLGMRYANRKGNLDILSGRQFSPGKYIDVAEYAKDPRLSVTPILFAKNEEGSNNTKIKPGHPFVLISEDPTIKSPEHIIQRWKEQQEPGFDGVPSVRFMYVTTPKASVEEWFEQLHTFMFTGNRDREKVIGNQYTCINIIRALWNSNEGKAAIRRQFPYRGSFDYINTTLTEMFKKIDNLSNDSNALKIYLTESISLGPGSPNKGTRLTFISQILHTLAYNTNIEGNNQGQLQTKVVDLVKSLMGDKEIFHHAVGRSDLGNFVEVYQDDNWNIAGKPCQINGKIDSYEFTGDMTDLINYIADNIFISRSGQKFIDLKREKYKKPLEQTYTPSAEYNNYIKLLEKLGFQDSLNLNEMEKSSFDGDSYIKQAEKLCKKFNARSDKGSKMAIMSKGRVDIIEDPIFKDSVNIRAYKEVNETQQEFINFNLSDQGSSKFTLDITRKTSDGDEVTITYNATISEGELQLVERIIPQNTSQSTQPNSDIDLSSKLEEFLEKNKDKYDKDSIRIFTAAINLGINRGNISKAKQNLLKNPKFEKIKPIAEKFFESISDIQQEENTQVCPITITISLII